MRTSLIVEFNKNQDIFLIILYDRLIGKSIRYGKQGNSISFLGDTDLGELFI